MLGEQVPQACPHGPQLTIQDFPANQVTEVIQEQSEHSFGKSSGFSEVSPFGEHADDCARAFFAVAEAVEFFVLQSIQSEVTYQNIIAWEYLDFCLKNLNAVLH